MDPTNASIASRLEEVGQLLAAQGADAFRVHAYRRAAAIVRAQPRPITDRLASGGLEALKALPGIGDSMARAIRDIAAHGRLAMLDRLRGDADPVKMLASVPGIGRIYADRLHHDFGIESLVYLEAAASDGRLARVVGFGEKRLAGIRDSLAHRLARIRRPVVMPDQPSVGELLDVDAEYRRRARAGELVTIAPRRFNPTHERWLPILHTTRGGRHYTALFSNTARAHALGRTRDWVVIYWDADGGGGQCTVITAERGGLKGRRIVRGREKEQLAVDTRKATA